MPCVEKNREFPIPIRLVVEAQSVRLKDAAGTKSSGAQKLVRIL